MRSDRRTFMKAGAALLASGATPLVYGQSNSLQQNADALLKGATDAGDVPGVVAVATTASDTIYEGGFGKRVLGQDTAMTPDTVVWIASMTKAVTGMAAMQMVEQGKIELDAPASRWAPDLAAAQVLAGWDDKGQPITRAPKRAITLRHLLTHTAGFSYDLWCPDIGHYMEVRKVPGVISCTNAALRTPLLFDPGERWEYGINIDWAGKMVENVTGMRLGDYMKQNIFEPLGMNSTAFAITDEMRSRMAKVHMRGESGAYAVTDIEIPQNPEFEMGGGGLYSTAGDYLKFVKLFLNDGKANGVQVLKPATVALMSTNAMGDTKVTMLKTAMPNLTRDAEFFPGMPKNWGLSFMINEEEAPTGRSPGSLAWAGLANTFYWIDQKKGVGGVYMTQTLPFVDEKALGLFYDFEKSVYQSMS